jgi:hypothetical protein
LLLDKKDVNRRCQNFCQTNVDDAILILGSFAKAMCELVWGSVILSKSNYIKKTIAFVAKMNPNNGFLALS